MPTTLVHLTQGLWKRSEELTAVAAVSYDGPPVCWFIACEGLLPQLAAYVGASMSSV